MKTAEEIKEKFASICKETCEGYQHEDILKAMEEYAEQFKQPSLDKQITDEEIKEWAENCSVSEITKTAKMQGAKWAIAEIIKRNVK